MPFANETVPLEMPLVGYAYVPMQQAEMRNLFDPEYGLKEGTIIEITVTNPGEAPITSNIKVQQSDLELLEELKEMGR